MIVRETIDAKEIKKVLCHPDIYPAISNDSSPDADDFIPPLQGVFYVAGYAPQLIGISCFHWFKDGMKFHPNVLPEFRSKYADEFVTKSLEMFYKPIYVEVPDKLVRFSKKHGFHPIGESNNKILMELL